MKKQLYYCTMTFSLPYSLGWFAHQIYKPLHNITAAQYPDHLGWRGQLCSATRRRWTQLFQGHSGAQLHHVHLHPEQCSPWRQPMQPHHPSVNSLANTPYTLSKYMNSITVWLTKHTFVLQEPTSASVWSSWCWACWCPLCWHGWPKTVG